MALQVPAREENVCDWGWGTTSRKNEADQLIEAAQMYPL